MKKIKSIGAANIRSLRVLPPFVDRKRRFENALRRFLSKDDTHVAACEPIRIRRYDSVFGYLQRWR